MKPICLILVFATALFAACNAENSFPPAENAFDAGRQFIDGCLKGKFDQAAFYMAADSENTKDLLQIKRVYNSKSPEQKQQYNAASIIVREEETVSDTVHIIHYMNSYDKVARKVKVVLRNNNWQVDFKYTFDGNL